MVFLAPSTMQMCEISIGDPVVMEDSENAIVRTAWPTNDKTLLSVAMTRKGEIKVKKNMTYFSKIRRSLENFPLPPGEILQIVVFV